MSSILTLGLDATRDDCWTALERLGLIRTYSPIERVMLLMYVLNAKAAQQRRPINANLLRDPTKLGDAHYSMKVSGDRVTFSASFTPVNGSNIPVVISCSSVGDPTLVVTTAALEAETINCLLRDLGVTDALVALQSGATDIQIEYGSANRALGMVAVKFGY